MATASETIQEVDELEALFEAVLQAYAPTDVVESPTGYWGDDFGLLSPLPNGAQLERNPTATTTSTDSLSRSNSLQEAVPFTTPPTSSSNARRRPLPQPPAGSSSSTPIPPTAPQIPPQPPQQSTPSIPSTTANGAPLNRRATTYKNFSQPVVFAPVAAADENGAGPSNLEAGSIPTGLETEYPDHDQAYLPTYYPDAQQDPNASVSLAIAPRLDEEDQYQSAPQQAYRFGDASGHEDTHSQRYLSVGSNASGPPQDRWNGDTGGTDTFMNYSLLRRPSTSSGFAGLAYLEEPSSHYEPSETWQRNEASVYDSEPSGSTYPQHSYPHSTARPPPTRQETIDSISNGTWENFSDLERRNTNVIQQIANFEHHPPLELHEEEVDPYEFDERRFVNLSLLSNIAVQLRDKVPRGTHVKGSVPYPRAFTGKDIVSTLHSIISRELVRESGIQPSDRRAALIVARSLQNLLFFYEVEWGSRQLQDGVEDVYMFLDDTMTEGGASGSDAQIEMDPIERTELPTGVLTVLTKCYSPSCDGPGCYVYDCPRKGLSQLPSVVESPLGTGREEWSKKVPPMVLASLSESEISRQTIIHKLISKEEQYLEDLDIIEDIFIKNLRTSQPPVMTPLILEDFLDEVFGNILELRECNRRLLEVLYVRQREQHPVIQSIGDIFLDVATEFRRVYPVYVGHHPLAEKRMREEIDQNPEFRLLLEKISRQLSSRPGSSTTMRLDLKHYLNRPSEHLQKYPVLLEAVCRETEPSNPDGDYLMAAIAAIQNLQDVARLRTFQSAMGKGNTGKWEWHDLAGPEARRDFTQEEGQRQSIIFELIKGEMAYVRDLENIETMYVRPLRNAEPHIIPPDRLDQFLTDVFHNYSELHSHHRRLVDKLHEIQRDEHPRIKSITAAVYDAVLNFREAYMEYIPNYPIAAYRIDDEVAKNEMFRNFVNNTVRHPDAHRLDMKNFINRPIPRLLRYELLLKQILSETPVYHEDRTAIPPVIELIKALGKETEPGVSNAKQKVELWKYNSNLVFKNGEYVDMDLLNEQRSLIHTGKLLRQPEGKSMEWTGWHELFVMLFDNYLVITKPREKDGVTKYHVFRRPIPLDLLSIVNFSDTAIQKNTGILRSFRNGDRARDLASDTASISSRRQEDNDGRAVYPCTIHHNGRLGGPYVLYAETASIRTDWKKKLEEGIGLRKVVQELNKVFAIESLSVDTFLLPTMSTGPNSAVWHDGTFFTGRVACSVPFNTPDGRGLVAVGCAEGVWIGYRHDSRSLRRVLHLKMVTQCSVLEDFGLFIVLADKVLYAYHLEALVPTTPGSIHASQTPQRIHGKDVHFFSIGILHGRTMIIYMKKRGNNDSVFYAVEPVIDKINERPKASGGLLNLKRNKAEWFRHYKDFSFPDAYDLIFLKARIAVLCAKGFMIMDLIDYRSVTIPQRDHPGFPYLARRCESCRPLGMFRPSEEEFLLCYDEFGLFVDRHGVPSRPAGIIEWEGTADRVAMHAPYVLLFDNRFIEVRHVETGRLVQIIPGNDIRCVWDGRTLDGGAAAVPLEGTEDKMNQEPRVHAVMNMPETASLPGVRPGRGIMQHVFELFPTIPLYLPGSLASPSTAPYFPVSFSPPRSPSLRPHYI